MFNMLKLVLKKHSFSHIQLITYIKTSFSTQLNPPTQLNKSDDRDIEIYPLYTKYKNANINLKTLTLSLIKFLEKTKNLYSQLNKESMAISEELFESPNQDFLKNQLVRINKQISSYSKELYYYDEIINLVNELLDNKNMLIEAEELKDQEIKNFSINEIKRLNEKLENLEKDVIESLLPEDEVSNLIYV